MKYILLSLLIASTAMADFEVHEWGSINIVTGDKKVTVGDITDDQSDLPPFVEVWSKQPATRPIMIEKPILYFYSDKQVNASVQVRYPSGIFTQWWPKPIFFRPTPPQKNQKPILKNGTLSWSVLVDPKGSFDKSMPVVKNHPWWGIARDVDAATLRSHTGQAEKFLFYRGAGEFKPTLKVDVDSKGDFVLVNTEGSDSKEVYTINVEDGKSPVISYQQSLKSKTAVFKSVDEAASHLQLRLEAKGLFAKEAAGMVKIWRKSMFEKIGQRAMYMMEEADIDKMLPLVVRPKPDKQVRVMLIRFECLSSSQRTMIEGWIKQLAHKDYKVRKSALEKLIDTGRVGEAVMRDAYKNAKDPEIKMSLREALQKITPINPNP